MSRAEASLDVKGELFLVQRKSQVVAVEKKRGRRVAVVEKLRKGRIVGVVKKRGVRVVVVKKRRGRVVAEEMR